MRWKADPGCVRQVERWAAGERSTDGTDQKEQLVDTLIGRHRTSVAATAELLGLPVDQIRRLIERVHERLAGQRRFVSPDDPDETLQREAVDLDGRIRNLAAMSDR